MVVGNNAEAPVRFFSLNVNGLEIAVLLSEMTGHFRIFFLEDNKSILVGHDTCISRVLIEQKCVKSSIDLEGVFFEFLELSTTKAILAIHELGVVGLSALGEEVWRFFAPDMLVDWTIDKEVLLLTTINQERIYIDATTGQVVGNSHY